MKHVAVALMVALVSTSAFAETLVAPPYPSNPPWKNITNKANADQKLMEWIPANQSENAINDILTEQAFYRLKNVDPALLVGNIFKQTAQACDRVRTNGPTRQTENGYPVAYAQIYCGHQKGTTIDVDIFLKAMGGHDGMYVVQREFHRPVDAGGTPGVISFAKGQDAQMKAFMGARTTANDYLVKQVKLLPK
jgi:hypothetical protein